MTTDPHSIGLRVLDIEHGFRLTNPEPVIEGELGNTLLLGKALNLALHLRGLNVLEGDDLKALTYAAAAIGIGAAELNTVLRELRELEWVRLRELGTRVQRVEIVVPALRDGFDVVGNRWLAFTCMPSVWGAPSRTRVMTRRPPAARSTSAGFRAPADMRSERSTTRARAARLGSNG